MHKHSYLKYLRKKNPPIYTMNHPKNRKAQKEKQNKKHTTENLQGK